MARERLLVERHDYMTLERRSMFIEPLYPEMRGEKVTTQARSEMIIGDHHALVYDQELVLASFSEISSCEH